MPNEQEKPSLLNEIMFWHFDKSTDGFVNDGKHPAWLSIYYTPWEYALENTLRDKSELKEFEIKGSQRVGVVFRIRDENGPMFGGRVSTITEKYYFCMVNYSLRRCGQGSSADGWRFILRRANGEEIVGDKLEVMDIKGADDTVTDHELRLYNKETIIAKELWSNYFKQQLPGK